MAQKMNQEFKAKWLAALRSGDYEQGSSYLHRDGKFCCLGVACNLMAKDGLLESHLEEDDEADIIWYGENCRGSTEILPDAAQRYMEIESDSGKLEHEYQTPHGYSYRHLTELNDDGVSFEEIADIIEQEF